MSDLKPETSAPIPHREQPRSRREFLTRGGAGFGALALIDLLRGESGAQDSFERRALRAPLQPRVAHLPSTAKSVRTPRDA